MNAGWPRERRGPARACSGSGGSRAGCSGRRRRRRGSGRRPGHGSHAAAKPEPGDRAADCAAAVRADQRLSKLDYVQALIIGAAQILALLAGISRDGVTMVAGMFRGLAREDAARFAFLLATPVILAAACSRSAT